MSRLVAERLSLKLINYTFRDYAEERSIPFTDMHRLARQDSDIDRSIDTLQVELARQGDCVIGSRLAIWVIPDADMRVYLKAPLLVRAGRIAQRERASVSAVIMHTHKRDKEDRQRYNALYGIDINAYRGHTDLIIDANRNSAMQICAIIANKCARDLANRGSVL